METTKTKLDAKTKRTLIFAGFSFILLGALASAASFYFQFNHPNGPRPWIGGVVTNYSYNALTLDTRDGEVSIIVSSSTVITNKREKVDPQDLIGKMINVDAKQIVDGRDIATYIRVVDAPKLPLR